MKIEKILEKMFKKAKEVTDVNLKGFNLFELGLEEFYKKRGKTYYIKKGNKIDFYKLNKNEVYKFSCNFGEVEKNSYEQQIKQEIQSPVESVNKTLNSLKNLGIRIEEKKEQKINPVQSNSIEVWKSQVEDYLKKRFDALENKQKELEKLIGEIGENFINLLNFTRKELKLEEFKISCSIN